MTRWTFDCHFIVGPGHHHVADVDQEQIVARLDIDSVALFAARLEAARAWCSLHLQNRERAIAGMRADADLTRLRLDAQDARVFGEERREAARGEAQRDLGEAGTSEGSTRPIGARQDRL